MKKVLSVAILLILLGFSIFVGFTAKYDSLYLTASMRRIKLDKDSTTQSIMTYNVKCISYPYNGETSWKYRASLICDLLQETQPSIICMQENKEKQYNFFKRYLKGYDSVATQRDSTYLTECLPIFFRSDLYELEKTQTFWLSDTPNQMSKTWDAEYLRICTFVVLKNKLTNKRFVVGNTHLDYKSAETQSKSIELIRNKLSVYNLPTIIMGDFNCTPDSRAIALAKQYFVDVGQGFEDENKGTVNNFRDDYRNVKIDYMLQLKNSFIIKNYKVIDKKYNNHFASDHFPIYAEIE